MFPFNKEYWNCIKRPTLFFFIAMLAGIIIGLCLTPIIKTDILWDSIDNLYLFKSITIRNCTIILTVYLSVVFTDKYAFFMYLLNGLNIGISVGTIVITDIKYLLLLLPHGIFEIPLILATGIVVSKGEKFVRNNTKRYLFMLLIHEVAIVLCALIEAFITPFVYRLVL